MKDKRTVKYFITGLAVLFCAFTAIRVVVKGRTDRLFLSLWSMVLAMLPLLLEKIFSCRLNLPFYIALQLYAIGPMLGHCWGLYYNTCWWDKLLHISAGVIFAILGAFLFELLTEGQQKSLTAALFALCFSIAVSGVWELVEFGADQLFGRDMQNDRVITHIHSYALGDSSDTLGSITHIESVTVNGNKLPGYLDIGLIDSMLDMLVETVGALAATLLIWLDRGKHACIEKVQVVQA